MNFNEKKEKLKELKKLKLICLVIVVIYVILGFLYFSYFLLFFFIAFLWAICGMICDEIKEKLEKTKTLLELYYDDREEYLDLTKKKKKYRKVYKRGGHKRFKERKEEK